MKISSDRKQVKVAEAARMLGCGKETVRRMIRRGIISAHCLPGSGLSAAKYIPADQVLEIANGRRSFRHIDDAAKAAGMPGWKTADWDHRDKLLQTKAGKLARLFGPEPIIEILKQMGLSRIDQADADQQRLLHGRLLRLAGYSGNSRTTGWRRRKEKQHDQNH